MTNRKRSSTLSIRAACPADSQEITLRDEDARAVTPGWRDRTAEAGGYAFTDQQGRLVALGGLRLDSDIAVPWLLCTDLVEDHKASIYRLAKQAMERVQQFARDGYRVANLIPKDSPSNRRFIESMGFSIIPSAGTGPDLFILPDHV